MSRLPSRKLSVLASYIYDGAGNKLGTRSRISYLSDRPLTTYAIQQPCRAEDHDYIGNYEFKNGRVHRVNTPYGYMAMGMFFTYLRDYQGNNRNHADYYAYGLPVQGSEVKDPDPYLYGGKEFYSLRGVNIYDFQARTYAPDIARFLQPDPLATENHGVSPYTYCNGDPINNIDPDGKLPLPIIAAIIGATIDFVTQVSINLTTGQSFTNALSNVDITSVMASGATSAFLGPTAGSGAKIAAGTINAADAIVDISVNNGIQYVGGSDNNEKTITNVAIDLGTSMLPDFGINHTPMNTSSYTRSSAAEIGTMNMTKEEMDRTTKIIFKINGEGLKKATGEDNPLKLKIEPVSSDVITEKPLPPTLKKLKYEKLF